MTNALVPATHADREAASRCGANGVQPEHWLSGEMDWHPLVQSHARHRVEAHNAALTAALKQLDFYNRDVLSFLPSSPVRWNRMQAVRAIAARLRALAIALTAPQESSPDD